jgi:hypothetical protein
LDVVTAALAAAETLGVLSDDVVLLPVDVWVAAVVGVALDDEELGVVVEDAESLGVISAVAGGVSEGKAELETSGSSAGVNG